MELKVYLFAVESTCVFLLDSILRYDLNTNFGKKERKKDENICVNKQEAKSMMNKIMLIRFMKYFDWNTIV